MGFELIGETMNPVEALDMIDRLRPDVVFTDIRMPDISGIELIKRIRDLDIDSKIVVVSGFAEFSYAQQSIKYGVFDYCLKPINPQRADELLARLAKELDSEKSRVHNRSEENDLLLLNEEDINPNFIQMLKYINANLHKKLYLKELAEKFYLNPTYCCALFKKTASGSFSQYIADLRMRKAKELLKDYNLSIKEVAIKTGYNDYSYFNKVFKRFYDITPAEFRKKD